MNCHSVTTPDARKGLRRSTALACACVLFVACACNSARQQLASQKVKIEKPLPVKAPFDISAYFVPSGWMGDGTHGTTYVQLNDAYRAKPRPNDADGVCIRLSYTRGNVGWAGIYWQHPDSNWGDRPGKEILQARKIVFWAAGERGGELVEFKAGGIRDLNKTYHDSFEISLGTVPLKREWQRYEIDVSTQDLSSVLGAFAWVAKGGANPDGLVFYLDDIRYE